MTTQSIACSLKQAIQANNEGVSFAMNGQDEQAVSSFSKSLRLFKQLLALGGEDEALTETFEPTCTLHSTTHELPQLRDSGFFLFNSVVSLAQTTSFHPEDSHIYCSLIILNLAVLHHQKALGGETIAQRVEGLRRAERFYSMVTTILANNEDPTIFSQATAILAQMAALNNLAYIRVETGDFKGSCECFRMLAWLVNRARTDYADILNERDLEGMMLNVLMANRQSVAPAA